jgi:hypothetical protein
MGIRLSLKIIQRGSLTSAASQPNVAFENLIHKDLPTTARLQHRVLPNKRIHNQPPPVKYLWRLAKPVLLLLQSLKPR